MKILFTLLTLSFFLASCSIIGGPNGYFPEKKYDFLEEEIEDNIAIPSDLDSPNTENPNLYLIIKISNLVVNIVKKGVKDNGIIFFKVTLNNL